MKVLFYLPNLSVCNGVASFCMNYYNELHEKLDIDFLVSYDVSSPYYDTIRKNGSKIYTMPNTLRVKKIFKFLDKIFEIEKYDIVHVNVINRGYFVLKSALKNKVKVRILHSHTTANGDTLIKRILRYPFKINALKYSNTYFACSNLAGEYLFKKKKYFIVNNAVKFDGDYEYNKEISPFSVGIIGRFTIQKNPFFILEIIKKIYNMDEKINFYWIGSGELYDTIVSKAKEYGLKNVTFVGNTSDTLSYYKKMSLFILPSLYEGLPVVGVEAQYLGIPCIFSNKITCDVLLNDNATMLDITSVEVWCNKIIEAKRNPQFVSNNNARKIYDIKKNGEKLLKKYEELVDIYYD